MGITLSQLSRSRWRSLQLIDFTTPMTALPGILQSWNATFTRNSEKRVEQDGALVTLAANQFGTSYDPVTGLYGYVPEPAATNLLRNSGLTGPSGAPTNWPPTVSGTYSLASAPSARNPSASALVCSASGAYSIILQPATVAANTIYTGSVYVTSVSGGLTARQVINTNIALLPAGATVSWPACEANPSGGGDSVIGTGVLTIRYTIADTAGSAQLRIGVGANLVATTGSVTLDSPQFESGVRVTSWILTPTGSTATRAADVLSVPLANIPGFSAAGYTLFADGRMDVAIMTGTERCAISLDDGTANNRSRIIAQAGGSVLTAVTSGGASQASVTEVAYGVGRYRAAYSCAANSFLRAVNGAAGTADTSGSMPVTPTSLRLGITYDNSQQFNGFMLRAGLIPQALTQAQLNGLTTL